MPKVEKPLAPKPGLTFTLTQAAFHHHGLRPLIDTPGLIAGVLESGLLIVQYAEGTRHCAPGMGVVGPAPAPSKPQELAPRRFRVELLLPPRELSPNRKTATVSQAKARAEVIKAYRESCAMRFRCFVAPALAVHCLRCPVRVDLDFYLAAVRVDNQPATPDYVENLRAEYLPYNPEDEDNARGAFKPGQDALQDAGIVPRDDAKHVTAGYTRLHRGKAANGKTMLVMTLTEPGYKEKEKENENGL